MSEHTFEVGEFTVTYVVRKHHPNDGAPYDDHAEIKGIIAQVNGFPSVQGHEFHDVFCAMNSIPQFFDKLTELANEDLKERQRDNHYED